MIYVESPPAPKHAVELSSSATAQDLQHAIADRGDLIHLNPQRLPSECIIIRYHGADLDPAEFLSDSGISSESEVQIQFIDPDVLEVERITAEQGAHGVAFKLDQPRLFLGKTGGCHGVIQRLQSHLPPSGG